MPRAAIAVPHSRVESGRVDLLIVFFIIFIRVLAMCSIRVRDMATMIGCV